MVWRERVEILEVSSGEIAEMRGDPQFRRWIEAIEAGIKRGDYTYDEAAEVWTYTQTSEGSS